MKIQATTNYSIFRPFPGNRAIKEIHVRRLIASIQNDNDLASHPIIVDMDYRVVDGQHRLEAAKRLKVPIFYIINKKATADQIIKNNDCKLSWTLPDKFNYWIQYGNDDYVQLKRIANDLGMTLDVILLYNESDRKDAIKGLLKNKIDDKKLTELMVIKEFWDINNQRVKSPIKFNRSACTIFKHFFSFNCVDPHELLERFKMCSKIFRPTNREDGIMQLCDIYNYKLRSSKIGMSVVRGQTVVTRMG